MGATLDAVPEILLEMPLRTVPATMLVLFAVRAGVGIVTVSLRLAPAPLIAATPL